MKFEKAFEAYAAFLETFSVAMTAANSINPVVIFFRCNHHRQCNHHYQCSQHIWISVSG
jgi:hypothetical protein